MELNIYDFIEGLEHDIAGFYRRLITMAVFPQSHELFQFMVEHSEGHSREVASLRDRHSKPKLNTTFFYELHKKIGKSLISEIEKGLSFSEAIDRIAKTEEQVGKMYHLLAEHYRSLGDYYRSIADDIDHLSEEEMQHRDMVYKEAEKA